MDVGLIIGITLAGLLLLTIVILFNYWIFRRKGKCRRTRYSHDITVNKAGGEILAVLATNRPPTGTGTNVNISISGNHRNHHKSWNLTPSPYFRQEPVRTSSYSKRQPTTRATNASVGSSSIPAQTHPSQPYILSTLPTISGNLDGVDRRNNLLFRSERPFMTPRALPPYTSEGPPTYNQAIAIQKFRNSIR